MSNTDSSVSVSTAYLPEETDPAVVALMERLKSRDIKDHASFILSFYGTDSELLKVIASPAMADDLAGPGGKSFAEVIQPGYRHITLSRDTINSALEPGALKHLSLGTSSTAAMLGKLHTDQENVPQSIRDWRSFLSLMLRLILDETYTKHTAGPFLGPKALEHWPSHDEHATAEIKWKTMFNLLTADEPTDILEPGQSLPTPPPRYIW